MKMTNSEKLVYYIQSFIAKTMYFNYATYLVALLFISLFIPLISLFRFVVDKCDDIYLDSKKGYIRVINSVDMNSYLENKDEINSQLNEKRKNL